MIELTDNTVQGSTGEHVITPSAGFQARGPAQCGLLWGVGLTGAGTGIHAAMSYGAFGLSGALQYATGAIDEHNVSTSDSYNNLISTGIQTMPTVAGALDHEEQFVSADDDEVRLNTANAGGSEKYHALLFNEISAARSGSFNLSSGTPTATVVLGFEYDVLFIFGTPNAASTINGGINSSSAYGTIGFSVGTAAADESCCGWGCEDNQTTTDTFYEYNDGNVLVIPWNGPATLVAGNVTSKLNDRFTVTASIHDAPVRAYGYLAIKGLSVSLQQWSATTGGPSQNLSDCGFAPEGSLHISACAAVASAGSGAVHMIGGYDGSTNRCASLASRDNQSVSDANRRQDNTNSLNMISSANVLDVSGTVSHAQTPVVTWSGTPAAAYDIGSIFMRTQVKDQGGGGLLVHPGMAGGMRG